MSTDNTLLFQRIERLNAVLRSLKTTFVGKDEIIDLMGICLVGRENLFLLGPPGTAKSALVRELARLIEGKSFEYLLTRFTEPNELFGPFDIRRLREGDLVTNTEGMLPEANLIFLDELLNANSAILNSLLMVLNERVFRRGRETRKLPALMIVGASNHLPEDDALAALFDRFLLRVNCDNVEADQLRQVLQAGWVLEQERNSQPDSISADELKEIQLGIGVMSLEEVRATYLELIGKLRNAGVKVSDRRAVKLQRLIAASALLSGRSAAIPSDLWVVRHIWDTEEQREVIAGIVNAVVEADPSEAKHPRALQGRLPDADELLSEVRNLRAQWERPETGYADRAVIRDRLRHLGARSEWISNALQREAVQQAVEAFWKLIAQHA
jgi:MoxR-like ATPase